MRWRDVKHGKVKQKKTKEKKVSLKYATVFDKFKAFLTDTFMITMPILYITIYLVFGSREGFRENMASGWLIILAVHFSIIMAFWLKSGQTPGYKAYNLRVVGLDNQKPKAIELVLRYLYFLILFMSVFGLLVSFFREDRRGLHDLLSGTVVVKDV
jgi:uncharacterized RDD family membrane protein YckC